MQSAPCLKGDKIPLKIWPRWSMPINFGKAYNAQQVLRYASQNDERNGGSGRDLDLIIFNNLPNLTIVLYIDINVDPPRYSFELLLLVSLRVNCLSASGDTDPRLSFYLCVYPSIHLLYFT